MPRPLSRPRSRRFDIRVRGDGYTSKLAAGDTVDGTGCALDGTQRHTRGGAPILEPTRDERDPVTAATPLSRLVRAGRELQLTEFAADLARPVPECVLEIEALLNAKVPFTPETESRCFRIAASDYVVLLTLRQFSQSLTEAAPNVSLRFCSLDQSVPDQLAAGDIDFAVLPAEFDLHLPSVPLFDD